MLSTLLACDARLTQRLRLSSQRSVWWPLAAFLAHSGDSWLWMAGLIVLWLFGNPAWHRNAALLAIAVVVQALLIFPLKFAIRRERPSGEWGSVYRSIDPHSFPSGHATRAILLAVMAAGLGPGWFAATLAVWAPLVSLARVATGVHYLSDVLAGAIIGLLMGLLMLALQAPLIEAFPFLF
jgi:undecaprenyl-diphosphatase